jgi:hypothetical protein
MHCERFLSRASTVGLAALVLFSGAGCSLDWPSVEEPTADQQNVLSPDEVLVRFRNHLTSEAVDVQFYATNEPLGMVPDDLFVEANLVTRSIGLAGRGIIEPRTQDAITFPCTSNLTIGTLGGAFADAETGDALGQGVPRWAQEEPLGLCGTEIAFEFMPGTDGYITRIRFGN